MKNLTRAFMAISLVFVLTVPALALAAGEEMKVSGELLSVDPDAQTFTVNDAVAGEVQISYDDQTQVSGSDATIAGLDAETGSTVTVFYTDDGTTKHATRIEFQQ